MIVDKLDSFSFVNDSGKGVKKMFDLLSEGDISLNNQYEVHSATIILGSSGVGKSSFALRLAGYDSELKSHKKNLNYIITKPNSDVISHHYTTSATIFPKLLHNNLTGATYYDFPGFEDTRGAAHDIATTYFIKKVMDNIRQVKILFLINHVSLSIQGGRNDFTKLIHHITKFIKNIDRFKDSMALIATKVPPSLNNSDSVVIDGIVEFIKEAKTALSQQSNEENDFSRDIQMIDVFLSQNGNSYPKIGLFKSPDREGFLSNIPLLQENKKSIEHVIEKLRFTEKAESDFGYFIPKQSLNDLSFIVDEINKHILIFVEEAGMEIQKYLSSKEDELHDINKLNDETYLMYNTLATLQEAVNNHTGSKNCAIELLDGVAFVNSTSVHQSLSKAVQYSSFSSFLHTVSNYATLDSFKCTTGLDSAIKYSYDSMKWYKLLTELFVRLSEYEVQKDVSSNSPCITLHKTVVQCVENEKYSERIWLPFLKKCYPKYDYTLNNIENMIIGKPKINALLRIMDLTLKDAVDFISCEFGRLKIQGHYIKITDVLNAISKTCESVQPRFIGIFSYFKVFIDTNMNFTDQQVELVIISPMWDIQGAPKIVLDGGHGDAHYSGNAADGANLEEDGKHGLPGPPGRSGGNFLGIGDMFINPERLTISVNGGQGGPGQNGGDGMMGKDGSDAQNDVSIVKQDLSQYASFIWAKYGVPKSANFVINRTEFIETFSPPSSHHEVYLNGKEGTKGGNGGDGGKGGYGGNAGFINIISFSSLDTTNIHKDMNNGNAGFDGKGGKGGIGGKFGNGLFVKIPALFGTILSSDIKVIEQSARALSGKNGIKGNNYADIQLPNKKIPFLNPSDVVKTYMSYAREKLNHDVMEFHLLEFLHKLESKNDLALIGCEENTNPLTVCGNNDGKVDGKPPSQHIFNKDSLILKNHRRRRHLQNDSVNIQDHTNEANFKNDHFQSNSANSIWSPIHNAINFLCNFFKPLKLYHRSNVLTNNNFLEESIQSLLGAKNIFNFHSTRNYNELQSSFTKLNVIESLTLADFFIRWRSKMKPYPYTEENLINSFEVRASVLNIIEKFESMMNVLSVEHLLTVITSKFDPVVLISALEKEVTNGNYTNIKQILFQSVVNNAHYPNDSHFYNCVLSKLDVILGLKNEDS